MITFVKVPDFKAFARMMEKKREDFYAAAMLAVVRDIIQGIETGMDVTGSFFPMLEPETIARKGHARPLIDKGLLRDEFTYQMKNKWRTDSGEVTIKPLTRAGKTKAGIKIRDIPRDEVGTYLQIDGIDSKSGKKFFRFFGISVDASKVILALIDQIVLESLEAM